MIWNEHSMLKDTHAFLGGSNYHWLNYDVNKLRATWSNMRAKQEGTELHAIAQQCIDHKIFLKGNRQTLPMYVNDAIHFNMRTEQPLVYSINCFGTADAIRFDEKKSFLRIHDLKTGVVPAHMEQLKIYAALFCLEYGKRYSYSVAPDGSNIELRIYQNDDIQIAHPNDVEITAIMDKIIDFDKHITEWSSDINGH